MCTIKNMLPMDSKRGVVTIDPEWVENCVLPMTLEGKFVTIDPKMGNKKIKIKITRSLHQ